MTIVLGLAMLASLLTFGSQRALGQVVPRASSQDKNLTISKILAGDIEAIKAAGSSGDKSYVPYLKHELEDTRYQNTSLSPIIWVRLTLAKLGETEQQQELWCEYGLEQPNLQRVAGAMAIVGGWYGIRGLQALTTPEVR